MPMLHVDVHVCITKAGGTGPTVELVLGSNPCTSMNK